MSENTTLHVDELDVVADAFEEAVDLLGFDLAVINSPEIDLLRGVVIFLAEQLRRHVQAIDSDDVAYLALDAQMLFEIVRAQPAAS